MDIKEREKLEKVERTLIEVNSKLDRHGEKLDDIQRLYREELASKDEVKILSKDVEKNSEDVKNIQASIKWVVLTVLSAVIMAILSLIIRGGE